MSRTLLAALILLLAAGQALAFDPFKAAGIDQHPGAKLPFDLDFRDETGKLVTLGRLIGDKPVLFAPVQHNCPNLCAVTLGNLLQAIQEQPLKPGRDFTIIAFGIDPKEDPADADASLQRLLGAFPSFPKSAIHGLTGSSANVAEVTHALGYRYAWDDKLQQYDHIAAVAVLTPAGALSHWLYGVSPDPKDIERALAGAAKGATASWGDQLLLLCYHYDPVTGRYSSMIWFALRTLAVLAVAALGLLIAGLAYRGLSRPKGHAE